MSCQVQINTINQLRGKDIIDDFSSEGINRILNIAKFNELNEKYTMFAKRKYPNLILDDNELLFSINEVDNTDSSRSTYWRDANYKTYWAVPNKNAFAKLQVEFDKAQQKPDEPVQVKVKPGVQELFDSNPELTAIGTQEQVKDIVYHGTHTKFAKFDKALVGSKTKADIKGKGFFFSNSLAIAQGYRQSLDKSNIYNDVVFYYYFKKDLGNRDINKITVEEWQNIVLDYFGSEDLNIQYLQKQSLEKTKALFEKFKNDKQFDTVEYSDELDFSEYIKDDSTVYSVILNSRNPLRVEGNNYQMLSIVKKEVENLKDSNDSIIFNNVEDGMSGGARFVANTYTVFEPEQIHILGSKQDIEGFKKFIGSKTQFMRTKSTKPQTRLASTIYELIPDITDAKLREIYNNYKNLMDKAREGKALPFETFKSLSTVYQVYNYKDTYIFGNWDPKNAVFITRVNSSPTSKELLAEAIPNLVSKGLDFASFVHCI
jgi:hypothetical protein